MNRYTFVLPSENQNACSPSAQMPFIMLYFHSIDKDISSIKIFCKDIHKSLKYVDEFSELKNDEIQKEHASLSLALLVYAKCRTKADVHDIMVFSISQ